MNQKPKALLFLIVSIIILVILNYYAYTLLYPSVEEVNKPRICPEKWVKNNSEEYFLLSNVRVELYELNVEWIKENCEVNSPTTLD